MQRPTQEVMYRIRGTIKDFLERENLLALVPVFETTQTVPGYGHLVVRLVHCMPCYGIILGWC